MPKHFRQQTQLQARRRFCFEQLEARRVLATTFQVTNGALVVSGTQGDDNVSIRGTEVPGRFEVSTPSGSQLADGVSGEIRVDLGGGNDELFIEGVYVAGNISLALGAGDDVVYLGGQVFSTAQDLNLSLGDGDDHLQMERAYIGRNQTIEGNAGNDVLGFTGETFLGQFWLGTSSAGATTLVGGDGDDTISAVVCYIVGPLKLDAGAGNDTAALIRSAVIGQTSFLGGDGFDHLVAGLCHFSTTVLFDGGMGSDYVVVAGSIVSQSADIQGQDGGDSVEIGNVIAKVLTINTGAGTDKCHVRASLFEQLFADLGDDDDDLTLQWNIIHGLAEVDGGLGLSDRLTDPGNIFSGIYRKRRFETFV
jgi:hypothetical protein